MVTTKNEMRKVVYKKDIYEPRIGQVFELVVPELKYDDKTDTLVEVGKIDIQEQLNSFKETALDAMLDRFNFIGSNGQQIDLDPDAVHEFYQTPDLLDLAQVKEKVDDLKEEQGIPWYYDDEQSIAAMNEYENLKKEEIENETSDKEKVE